MKFVATHRLLLNGITRRVMRQNDYWLTQGGEKLYAGSAEELSSVANRRKSESASRASSKTPAPSPLLDSGEQKGKE